MSAKRMALVVALSLIVAGAGVAQAGYVDAVIGDGALAYWQFEDGLQGATMAHGATAADTQGGNNGVYQNGVPLARGAYRGSTAVDFDRTSTNHVLTTTLGNFGSQLVSGHTLEFWVRTSDTSQIDQLIGTLNQTDGTGFVVDMNRTSTGGYSAGRTNFFLRASTNQQLNRHTGDTLYDDRWHHVAWAVTDPSTNTVTTYFDGAPTTFGAFNQSPSNFTNFQFPLAIGANNNRGTIVEFADAFVDDVAVYNGPLSAAQVAAHYNQVPRVDLHYRDYRAPSQTWLDQSPNLNDGTLGSTSAVEGTDPTPVGRGFEFSRAQHDVVTIPRHSSMNFGDIGAGDDFTIEMWVKPESAFTGQTVMLETRGATWRGLGFLVNANGELSTFLNPATGAATLTAAGQSLRQDWLQHVLVAFDSDGNGSTGTASFYLNGLLVAAESWSGLNGSIDDTGAFLIGHGHGGTGWLPWDGGIGMLRTWGYALGASDVLSAYQENHGYFVPEPGTMTLLAFGLGAAAIRRRRRRK